MATVLNGIKFEVVSNQEILHMYDDPDDTNHGDPRKCLRYIEATTGATFILKITLTPDYVQGPCDAVRVKVFFDDGPMGFYQDILTSPSPCVPRNASFSHISEYCRETRQWKQGALSFGKLDIKETSDTKLELAQSSLLGRIRLDVCRVSHLNTVAQPPSFSTGVKRVAEVSEKVLKGKAITNTIELAKLENGRKPRDSISCLNIPGDLGLSTIIDILYRSRETLKIIGCIPRTPSPNAESDPIDLTIASDPAAELRTLRARISELENQTKIKGERSDTPACVKRERESKTTATPRKRRRPSDSPDLTEQPKSHRKPTCVEEIDLTSD